MAVKSRSAILLFVFLGFILVYLPGTALIFVCIRRRYRRRSDEKSRTEAADAVAKSMPHWAAPVELGNIQPPPPPPPPPPAVAKIPPIRSLQTVKSRNLPTMHRVMDETETVVDKPRVPTTEIAAPKPSRPSSERRHHIQVQNMECLAAGAGAGAGGRPQNPFDDDDDDNDNDAVAPPAPFHTAHYGLHAALVTEQSPAQVRKAGERSASVSDAPRVKSQVVKPEHAAAGQVPKGRWV